MNMIRRQTTYFSGRWIIFGLSLLFFLNFIGCAHQTMNIKVSAVAKKYCPRAILVTPFEEQRMIRGSREEVIKFTNHFQKTLARLGWPIVNRARMKEVITESQVQDFLNSNGDVAGAKKLAKLLAVDVVIFGQLFCYHKEINLRGMGIANQNWPTTVGFSARAVNINDGSVLWSITVADEDSLIDPSSVSVEAHAIKVVNKAITELINQGVKTN